MNEETNLRLPEAYTDIIKATTLSGFTMSSDMLTCSLLRALAASKPSGRFLEIGTGTGLSTSWIIDGMDDDSVLVSIDNDPAFLKIARSSLGKDKRLKLINSDGADWIAENRKSKFDYIFADSWPGKYLLLEEVLEMLNNGGLYIIDDMDPQPNWPEGHQEKVAMLISLLEKREDLLLTKLNWATGIIIAVKR